MLRSFISIEIPPEVQTIMAAEIKNLQATLPRTLVRWVPNANLHLTLKFLGDVAPENLKQLAKNIWGEISQYPTFVMQLIGFGAYPSTRHPRVIWIGIKAPDDLQTIQRIAESAAKQMGYPPEDRSFSPHLTIGRVNQSATLDGLNKIRSALSMAKPSLLASVQVKAIQIMKSDLCPGGSIYTCLYSLPLRQ